MARKKHKSTRKKSSRKRPAVKKPVRKRPIVRKPLSGRDILARFPDAKSIRKRLIKLWRKPKLTKQQEFEQRVLMRELARLSVLRASIRRLPPKRKEVPERIIRKKRVIVPPRKDIGKLKPEELPTEDHLSITDWSILTKYLYVFKIYGWDSRGKRVKQEFTLRSNELMSKHDAVAIARASRESYRPRIKIYRVRLLEILAKKRKKRRK